jgi:hypothetical protein
VLAAERIARAWDVGDREDSLEGVVQEPSFAGSFGQEARRETQRGCWSRGVSGCPPPVHK